MTGPHAGLFRGLYDDAAIFPPGNLPLADAVPAHRAWLRSPHAATVGVFVCSAGRLDELVALGADFPVSVTVPPPVVEGAGSGRHETPSRDPLPAVLARDDLEIASVEVPLAAVDWDLLADAVRRTQAFVEVRLADLTPALAARLAAAGMRLKVRTGGADASMFPPPEALAAGIVTAVSADLPFKLTAGLHNALRHRDPDTGFEHHGFGNVLAATAAAQAGADVPQVAAVLDTTDPDAVVRALRGLSEQELAAVRRQFVSFGTCSIQEPLDDLAALGLLPAPTGADA